MAIEINDFVLPITVHEARDYIQSQTDSFGAFYDMDRTTELIAMFNLEMRKLEKRAQSVSGMANMNLANKNSMIRSLIKLQVPEVLFFPLDKVGQRRKTAGLDAAIEDSIIESPAVSEVAKEVTRCYKQHKAFTNMINKGFTRMAWPQSAALSKDGHRMNIAHPTWKVLNTSRLQAEDPNVQQIDRKLADLLVEPKGYTLVRADSAQIEPCINFSTQCRDELIMNLILAYQDAYFGIWRYCVLDPREEDLLRADFQKNYVHIPVTDELKEHRQNIKTLTNAGSYGSANLDRVNPELADAYDRRIVHHPLRIAREAKVREDVKRGKTTFYGAFGTAVTPGPTQTYKPGDDGWTNHVIRCGINNPIQTTASELMLHSVNRAREILKHAHDTHICFYKHDEACFYVSDRDIKDGILEELDGITAYNVKGWIPIRSELELGVKKGEYPTYLKGAS